MNRALLLHDRLAPPRNHDAYLEVLDPNPRGGCVKVFDAAERKDRYVEMADILSAPRGSRTFPINPAYVSIALIGRPFGGVNSLDPSPRLPQNPTIDCG